MVKRELTCIGCPLGCMLYIEMENEEVRMVTGHTCARGKQYAIKEVTNPTRIVTSTVKVVGGELPVVSVKTDSDIPKDKVRACILELKDITVTAPIYIGETILENVCGINVNIVATKNIRSIKTKSF